MQRAILCYGDSNTWGYVPSQDRTMAIRRYSRKERWTGRLQGLLGDKYYVVEEGLNSRTTNIDYQIPPDRNGKTYLPPCLYTHAPLDLVVLALGGNDLKAYFNRTAQEICDGLAELVNIIQVSSYGLNMQCAPQVLLVSPPKMSPAIEKYTDENGVFIFEGATKKAETLVSLCSGLAKEKQCFYLDISNSVIPSDIDGLHFDVEGHKIISQLIYEKIKNIYE
jgi:lysophospholipase L1-like esterase